VKKNWSEMDQKIKTVRRNLIHGTLDDAKFAKLVQDLNEAEGIAMADISQLLGFTSEADFKKLYKEEKKVERRELEQFVDDEKRELEAIDNLSYVLNEIFAAYGSEVANGFLFFFYKGKMHLMVQEDKETERRIEVLAKYAKRDDLQINILLRRALDALFDKIKAETGEDPRTLREVRADLLEEDTESTNGEESVSEESPEPQETDHE